MSSSIGDEHLGEFAREQLESARSDPRLGRGRGGMIADLFDAFEEAERMRELGVWGLYELSLSVEREETKLGVHRDDPDLSRDDHASLQAAWERADMAKAEIANEHPHLHAMALVSMLSALDACIEELVPNLRAMQAKYFMREVMPGRLSDDERRAWDDLDDELRDRIEEAAIKTHAKPKRKQDLQVRGVGVRRYEAVLKYAGLQSLPDRPIPDDLDRALAEIGSLRNVIVHRAGRVDPDALEAAPSLRYSEGEFVRIGRRDYRTYSAAISAYAHDVVRRPMRSWIEPVDLSQWRGYVRIGA